jgi:Homing endonuclease associated repeat
MERFLALSRNDQLRAYLDVRRFLALDAPAKDDRDRKLEREEKALSALRQVVAHLGRKPKAREFEPALKELGLDGDWSTAKLIRIFRSWSNALESVDGQPRQSPEQAAMRAYSRGRRRSHEDYRTAVRRWITTDPPNLAWHAYDDWAERTNKLLAEGELPLPRATTITTSSLTPGATLCVTRVERSRSMMPSSRARRQWPTTATAPTT